MGYPILIKASAGGGGKGMRLVTDPKKFKNALTEAKQEAKASFDNDQVLLEKYLLPARHVEVQIFSDQTGQTVYLFDRDCSIQRRHQKIIEEAPAPNLPQTLRDKMGQTAVLAAKAINYVGAGTIEFLVTPKNEFYFMEMNTRLQVEHPVTESITGLDLVAWQLKIASGECLPLKQNEIQNYGHAIEARIYAENPQQNFMPSIGHLEVLHFPIEHARIDSGVTQGDNITPYYDPLIAKIITWAETRELAIAKLKEALSQTYIIGVENNIQYLSSLLKQPDFIAANLQTRFIEEHQNSLLPSTDKLAPHILALATIAELHARELNAKQVAQQSNDASSPWNYRDHWRLNSEVEQILQFWHLNQHYKIRAQQKHDCIIMDNLKVQVHWKNNFELLANINDQSYPAAVFHKKEIIHLFYQGEHYKISLNNPKTYVTHLTSQQAQFISPMPSTVVDICVAPGQEVNAGDKLMVLEAMKMQHTIFAPEAGKIKTINYQIGDLLPEGVTLLEFEN
jgi:3-methylcrotonyl-CoA carboxylase alpha subunit